MMGDWLGYTWPDTENNLGLISLATNFLMVWLKWAVSTFSKLSCPNCGSWSICACRSGRERVWSKNCVWCTGRKILLWVRDFMLYTYFPDLTIKHCHDTRTKTAWSSRAFPGLGKHINRAMWSQTKIHLPSPPNADSWIYIAIYMWGWLQGVWKDSKEIDTRQKSQPYLLSADYKLLFSYNS